MSPEQKACPHQIGDKVRVIAEMLPASYREDWRDVEAYVVGIDYQQHSPSGYGITISEAWPPKGRGDYIDDFDADALANLTRSTPLRDPGGDVEAVAAAILLEQYANDMTARCASAAEGSRTDGDYEFANAMEAKRDAYSDMTMRLRAALAALPSQTAGEGVREALEPILRFHETGGHEGDGSDAAIARARQALSAPSSLDKAE